mmetsp:Transcript_1797/g.1586  ORF Transcript_1797/g.1586 Transcript_1797/m.1586 type:complete len:122 (+) Transcript_1797:505-870(+)
MVKEDPTPEEMACEYNYSDSIVNFNKGNEKRYSKSRRIIKKLMKNLVKLRNQLLNTYLELKNCIEDSETVWYSFYQKSDIVNYCDLISRLKETKYFTPHYLWDIPVKDHEEEYYKDGELTE